MFRFTELSLHGWDVLPNVRLKLDRDVILLSGPNGSGKTTILDALRTLLHAKNLSSRRRLSNYLRRPDQPALIRGIVSNVDAGSGPPFRRERIVAPEVTLACGLFPDPKGSERRFAILPGRAPIDAVRAALESRDHYTPERYDTALQGAGVTRSLMQVLALEQGKTNALAELAPRKLLSHVLELTGDQAVLDRYREARRRYEESAGEVARQTQGLLARQAELSRVEQEVRRLDAHEAQAAKVLELERRLPATRLQAALRRRREVGAKVEELRTKVRKGETEAQALEAALLSARAREERVRAAFGEAEARLGAARAETETQLVERSSAQAELRRLEEDAAELVRLPALAPEACEAALSDAQGALARAEDAHRVAAAAVEAARGIVERLRAGLPLLPAGVEKARAALAGAGIAHELLADLITVEDGTLARAAEASLGDARFSLLVDPARIEEATALAREAGVPGPIAPLSEPVGERQIGPLRLAARAPAWAAEWGRTVELDGNGDWRDGRGHWFGREVAPALGGASRRAALPRAEAELASAEAALAERAARIEGLRAAVQRATAELKVALRRAHLEKGAQRLPSARERVRLAGEAFERADAAQRERQKARDAARDDGVTAQSELRQAESERERYLRQLEGERTALAQLEGAVLEIDREIAALEPQVDAGLRARADAGELDSEETVQRDLDRARADLTALGPPPPPEVRAEAGHLRVAVLELDGHVAKRRQEVEQAQTELSECRRRYLDVVRTALWDYSRRARELGGGAGVKVEMEIPELRDDDRSLDEAELSVRFGFDGKAPLLSGDPSFSGGQQVISGLILLMSTVEAAGRGFFILDEPFAHLSVDRVDDVGRFLKAAHAQFIITAPTTLDRAQLDPAALVITLFKKRPNESHAPLPVVAEA